MLHQLIIHYTLYTLPEWVSSYVKYAGLMEYGSPLIQQIHGIHCTVCLLTLS